MRPRWFLACLLFLAGMVFAHEPADLVESIDQSLVVIPAERGDRGALFLTPEQQAQIIDRAYPLLAARWPFNKVFVCWEDSAAAYPEQRKLVQDAITATWQAESALQFIGWGDCKPKSRGIRIMVEDTGPHVKYLGVFLDGEPQGMVLNFTYAAWGSSCQSQLESCNRMIAVHEFGHAIGFAHEQNRPDTPGECQEGPQGDDGDDIQLTPWDPHSVMNYCNEAYMNDGQLSAFDIRAVRYIYGDPS